MPTWATQQIHNPVLHLKRGETAPFDGALLPIEDLAKLETDHLNAQLYKDELAKHQGETPLYAPTDHSLDVIIGVAALVVGIIIGHSLLQ
jgi:hypothetical protein